LLLAEKAKRTRAEKIKRQRVLLLEDQDSVLRDNEEFMPDIPHGTSLVLDQNHVFSDLYYKKSRYKVYWGGRGSGKSWAIAEALVRKAAAVPLRILCLREYQNSIKDSSHKIIADTIRRLGLQSWFNITATGITSRVGSEFIFKGCFGNIDGIRSTEGIDICWLEEAHSISEASWRVIIPTIRKDGSEIWVSFNMNEENDATYRRLVVHKRPPERAIVHKVNYDSNPFFSDTLREEMEFDKEYDYELYLHVWEGGPKKISDAIVLNRKYRVEPFDLDLWVQDGVGAPLTLRYGMDFGYSQDPTALTRSFVHEVQKPGEPYPLRTLYISHEAYGTHVELDELPEFMDSVPGVRDWPIGADCSAPATISFLGNKGFNIYGAEKWQGSVEDGIRYLRGFNGGIVIHPQCVNTAKEAYLWRWKTDPKRVDEHGQPIVLPVLVPGNEHTWDATRYGHDGEITKGGIQGLWERLGRQQQGQQAH
jgi:phage terminase large subunit